MDDSHVDLSPLDPTRDERHWNALVASIALRGMAVRMRQLSVVHQLHAWARPALTMAAVLACVSALGGSFGQRPTESAAAAPNDPVWVMSTWVTQNQVPSTAAVLDLFGGSYERK